METKTIPKNRILKDKMRLNPNCSEMCFRLTGDLEYIKNGILQMLDIWENEYKDEKDFIWVSKKKKEIEELREKIDKMKNIKDFEKICFSFTCNYPTFFKEENNSLIVATCNNHEWAGGGLDYEDLDEKEYSWYDIAGRVYFKVIAEEKDFVVAKEEYIEEPRFLFLNKKDVPPYEYEKNFEVITRGNKFYSFNNNQILELEQAEGIEVDKLKCLAGIGWDGK